MKKSYFLAVVSGVLIFLLFFFGKTSKPKSDINATNTSASGNLSFDEFEQQLVARLSTQDKEQWKQLSQQLKKSEGDTASYRNTSNLLADFWEKQQNGSLFAYYKYLYASSVNTAKALSDASDLMLEVFKNNPDTSISNNLLTFAVRSLENASAKDPQNINLKVKLAETYVQTSPDPMKGISMLRALGDSLPENMDVQMSLARLSLQSGQLEKAKERLQKILQKQPQNTEAMYFMAITEAQMGHADEAVRLLELCKTLVNNEEFSNEINNLIQEIKNKKV